MSKAEERALKEYPQNIMMDYNGSHDLNYYKRVLYQQGYKQAEKDIALTWGDVRELHIIFTEIDVEIELGKTDIKAETLGYYQEVLNRFNKQKEDGKVQNRT